jgi:hypothetical protein
MTVPVQLRIDKDLLDRIKRTARLQAAKEDRDIDWRDLFRQTLAEKFPLITIRNKR